MVLLAERAPHPGSLYRRGWVMSHPKGFSIINKLQDKIIYFYSLSVNYNNRSPVVGYDSQNGINCRQGGTIIYELTKNLVINNNIARLYFKLTITWLFSYRYA
jgi:hypothetical protein